MQGIFKIPSSHKTCFVFSIINQSGHCRETFVPFQFYKLVSKASYVDVLTIGSSEGSDFYRVSYYVCIINFLNLQCTCY